MNELKWLFWVILYIAFGITVGLLAGCTNTPEKQPLSINNYTQTDYNYNCLDGTKTFTQIIVCYQQQDNAEKTQNRITNEMLDHRSDKK